MKSSNTLKLNKPLSHLRQAQLAAALKALPLKKKAKQKGEAKEKKSVDLDKLKEKVEKAEVKARDSKRITKEGACL